MVIKMDNKAMGKRIKIVRKESGITSERLSELCNLDATYMRQLEAGLKTPSLPVFTGICNALHVSPTYILQGELEPAVLSGLEKLVALCENATPSRIELVIAIVKTISAY